MAAVADSGMELRAAGVGDFDEVLALAKSFYVEEGFATPDVELAANLSTLIGSAAARVAVVTDDGDVCGFAITTTSFGLESGLLAELEDLYVRPEARRQGVAQQLIEDSAQWARNRGCHHLEVVLAPNSHDVSGLRDYYEARGFVDEGRRLLSRTL